MHELKVQIHDLHTLAVIAAAIAAIPGMAYTADGVAIHSEPQGTKPGIATTMSPAAQQAARDSVAQGTAAGATGKPPKEPKAPKADAKEVAAKEAKDTKSEPPEATPETASAEEPPKVVKYEDSGLAELITKANTKDSPATKAVLEKFNARNAEGKLKGSALKPEDFEAARAAFNAIIAGGDGVAD